MTAAKAKWELAEQSQAIPSFFYEKFRLHPIVASLLMARGIDDEQKLRIYLQPTIKQLHDPFLFADMERVVQRIRQAIERDEKICIYGDYDADGVSSTSLMAEAMSALKANFEYYIPHRANEGYGLKVQAVEELAQKGVTLIVTVDTGISAIEQIAYATSLGIDVIVTDHHEAPLNLPRAYAIINPKQPHCTYPFKGLAGVGVALKVAHALLGELPEWAFQFAAIGTIADMMPLHDENRAIVKLGIKAINEDPLPAFEAFMEDVLRKTELRTEDIGFQLAPRINASGRLDCAAQAVRYLMAQSVEDASELLANLDALNHERRQLVREFSEQAKQMVEQMPIKDVRVLVLASEQWTAGVVGIVASKLLETYSKSAIVLSIDSQTGMAKGSARSYNGLDMIQALRSMEHLFEQYGGHQGAAGVTLHSSFIEEFRIKMNDFSRAYQSDEEMIPIRHVDAVCSMSDITLELLEQLELLEPFGPENKQPYFRIDGLNVDHVELMGKQNEHAKLFVRSHDNRSSLQEIVAFNRPQLIDELADQAELSVLCKLSINEFKGNSKPQFMLRDWKSQRMQCFDWRAWRQSSALWEKITQRLRALPDGEVAVFVAHELDYRQLCDRLNKDDIHAWTMARDGTLLSIEPSQDQSFTASDVRELIVLTMPEQPHLMLTQALQMFSLDSLYIVAQATQQTHPLRVPTYEQFSRVYRWLTGQSLPLAKDSRTWLEGMQQVQINANQMRFVIEVFCELDILQWTDGGIVTVKTEQKRSLSSSQLIQNMEKAELQQQFLQSCRAPELRQWLFELEKTTTSEVHS